MPRRSSVDLNLNLLVALDHLLRERTVTEAARVMGVSQPTASTDLARLRRHFDDPLVQRVGGSPVLSPLGQELQPLVREALDAAHRAFGAGLAFDPSTSDRRFTAHGSEYTGRILAPSLAQAVTSAGAELSFELRRLPDLAATPLDETLRTVDGLFLPRGPVRTYPSLDVFEDRWVCVVDAGNDAVGERLTLDVAARLPWAATPPRGGQPLLTMHPLRAAGVNPRVAAVADSFTTVPELVVGTDRVAVVQERLLDERLRSRLRVVEYVADLPPILMAFFWHPSRQPDPAHSWLCTQLRAVGRGLPSVAES